MLAVGGDDVKGGWPAVGVLGVCGFEDCCEGWWADWDGMVIGIGKFWAVTIGVVLGVVL